MLGAPIEIGLRAETRECDPDTDAISIEAVMNEASQFTIVDFTWDHGIESDTVAGDGVYERRIFNPFYLESGEAIVRFFPCDTQCREPAYEVEVEVIEPEKFP